MEELQTNVVGDHKKESCSIDNLDEGDSSDSQGSGSDQSDDIKLYESYKRCTSYVNRAKFLDIVCSVLSEYKYVGPSQRADLILACRYSFLFSLHSLSRIKVLSFVILNNLTDPCFICLNIGLVTFVDNFFVF